MNHSGELLRLERVCKDYRSGDERSVQVLDGIDLQIEENQILALLGQSGSGKSTLLRIIAGLIPATSGTVRYRGLPVVGPARGIAMVFQSFALLPWLTVLQNVELGLEALRMPKSERRERALRGIDLIGLDGYESAYPRELSGGMRQRVGLARALVVRPDVLLLDEPFSALDVLTAEALRGDLMELWSERSMPMQAMVLVSHNIQEAVEIADRIVILSKNPGRIRANIPVGLPHPRDPHAATFQSLVEEVYSLITTPTTRPAERRLTGIKPEITIGHRLPAAYIQRMIGLIDTIAEPPHSGRADLPVLVATLHLSIDELLTLGEGLQLLQFVNVAEGDITLTESGKAFWEADLQQRKEIFAQHLLHHVPLAAHILRVLDEREGHSAPAERFLSELEDHLSEAESQRVLNTVIGWARYAEIFAYDDNNRTLSLENP